MVHTNRFISVKETLPKQDEEVIVLYDDLNVAPKQNSIWTYCR